MITQTNKTILFEVFNEEKLNLITLIGDVENQISIDDEKVKEINNKLLVENFNEFLIKFDPKIYSYMDVENKKVAYTLVKNPNIPDSLYNEIPLNLDNSFIKMLITLIENRKNIDLKNIDFKYEDILELISPRKIINDIKQLRKEINYLYEKYESLPDANPKKMDIGENLNYKFYQASKNYNNILAMLPLAIEDIKTKLLLSDTNTNINVEKIKLGLLEFNEVGELEFIETKEENLVNKAIGNYNENLSLIFKNDYTDSNENPQEYIKELVSRTFVPMVTLNREIDYQKEVSNYNQYLEIYRQSQDDFIKIAKSLIEKIIGVKLFFDQYDVKNSKMKPKLLITNISNELLINEKNLDRLEKYLKTVNDKNDFENTIWYGIYPNVSMKETLKQGKGIFKTKENKEDSSINSLENLSSLINVLYKYKIQCFVSFERNEESSFDNLSVNGIEKYVNKTKILENQNFSEYIIPVIPNFTIIPKDKSGVKLDKKANYENDCITFSNKDNFEFFIEGIYIDSAYVAAGLVGAYQCPNYLKNRFNNVLSNNPGVRFNIEADDNSYIVKTTMAREISGFTAGIKDQINRNNYGFVFASELGTYDNKKITNATVYKARSLQKNQSDDYEAIYKTQASTYIERIIRFETNDFKSDKLNYFFSNSPNSRKTKWLKEVDYVNSILKVGDDISHLIDLQNNICQLNIAFLGEVKNLKVEINKNN